MSRTRSRHRVQAQSLVDDFWLQPENQLDPRPSLPLRRRTWSITPTQLISCATLFRAPLLTILAPYNHIVPERKKGASIGTKNGLHRALKSCPTNPPHRDKSP